MNALSRTLTAAVVLSLAACGSSEQVRSGADAKAAPKADSQPMAGMGDTNSSPSAAMIAQVELHLKTLDGKTGDQLKALLPEHRQLTANLIASLSDEMRKMNMPADAAWTTVVDSLRQDLVRFPEMSPAELTTAMAAHRGRVTRLIAMHRSMIAKMGM
ncbi:MAG TPA: hypothetical protein VG916_08040 [Gemmatimonadaceae bacterium]|nr:hypothetical protein [Gemmatimonadaceae bacterium]